MKRLLTLRIPIIVLTLLAMAPGVHAASWDFDKMIREVEARLPIVEKQSEVIVKMLASEKHRAKIQAEIEQHFSSGRTENVPLQETYLARVLSELGMPLSKSTLHEGWIYGDSAWSSRMEVTLLSPNVLIDLARGGEAAKGSPLYWDPASLLSDRTRAEKLANVCARLLSLQRPVQLAARQNLDLSNISNSALMSGGGGSTYYSSGVYGIFIPNVRVSSSAIYLEMIEYDKAKMNRIHPAFLAYLKQQASYLNEIGYSLKFSSQNFSSVEKYVDARLAQLAETADLSELTAPAKRDAGASDLDDLLPPP